MNAKNKEIEAGTNGNARLRGTVLRQLAALAKMKTPELREKWRELNGTEPPAYNRQHLVRRLAYRIQEMYYGGLNERANQRLAELGQTDVLASIASKPEKKSVATQLVPGTRLRRRWRGIEYEVAVVEGGFLYKGTVYRSLTAVSETITGMKRSGRDFFGLPRIRSCKRKSRNA